MRSSGATLVTDREASALQHLWRLRFMTAAQLAEMLFAGSAVTPRSRTVMTQRLVATLKRRSLVAAMPRAAGGPTGGETPPTYYLTADGLRVARSLWPGTAPTQLRSSGTYLAHHAVATADVMLAFRRAARANPDHELVGWECDWQAALPLGASLVEPDGYLLYRAGPRRLHAFLEVDMSSEHARSIALKMRRYLDVHRAGEWRVRFPVWPVILVIAETEARLAQLRRIAEVVSSLPGGTWHTAASFHFATFAAVTGSAGPLGEVWEAVGRFGRVGLLPRTVIGAIGDHDGTARAGAVAQLVNDGSMKGR